MSNPIVALVSIIANILIFVIFVDSLLSFVLPPYHPIRATLGRVLNPLYNPIRKTVPPVGMMDFTPIILMVVIWVLERLIISLLT